MSSSSPGGTTGLLTEAAGGAMSMGQAVIQAAATFVGVISTLASLLPAFLAVAGVTVLVMMASTYGPGWVAEAELGMRGTVFPVWRDDVSDWVSLARQIFNNLICWWNGFTFWSTGLLRHVLLPTLRECRIRPLLTAAAQFIKVVALDWVVVIVSGRFRTQYVDFSRISPAGAAMFQAWIDLYTCSCSDLGDVLRTTPILSPLLLLPPTWPLILFSQQWTDPQTWCTVEHVANTGVFLLRQIVQLATQILNVLGGNTGPNFVFIRPDLREGAVILCRALECARKSIENAMQLWWDRYVPFDFKWSGFLVAAEVFSCIVVRTFTWVFLVLINIDQAVQYPGNAWWETVSKPEVIILINMWAAPSPWASVRVPVAPLSTPVRYTMTNYYLDQNEQSTPWGAANPQYQRPRLTEGLCTLVERAVCDPNDQGMGCFSNIAQNLLMGFDFCCLVTTAGTTLADAASGLMEASFHVAKGADEFFMTLDAQPFTTVLRRDLIAFVRCALAAFALIPNFGGALRDLLTGIATWVISMVDFGIRVLIGLATLPYFLLSLHDVTNFVQTPNTALDFFVAIQEGLIADTPDSVRNSLCILANNAFPIPPIPCSQCKVGGFIPPVSGGNRRDLRFFDEAGNPLNTPLSLMREAWGLPPPLENEASYHITPLIYYGSNHTSNPIELYNLLYVNVNSLDPRTYLPWHNLRDVDSFVDAKKAKMLATWRDRQRCNQRAHELRQMALHEPRLYRFKAKRGDFANETCTQKRDMPLVASWHERETDGLVTVKRLNGRLTSLPTTPPIIGCDPTPQCFDLCCLLRTLLTLAVHVVELLARFFNGLILGRASQQGTTQDYPYFTGEFANFGRPTFESDLVKGILLVFAPIKCVCQVLNLIIPVTPSAFTAGRPDLCCFVQRLGELVSCTLQVIINAINALALGSNTNWAYFRFGLFRQDVETLLDLALEVVTCICVFVRAVFPLDYIPGYAQATDFDPCCGVEVLLDFAIEVTRFILQIIISLVTITIDPESFCYWRLDVTNDHQCGGTLDNIGVVKQWDRLNEVLLPKHTIGKTGAYHNLPDGSVTWIADDNPTSSGGACYTTCGIDNGANGIVPCICQILDTLIPYRAHPERKVNCSPDPALKNCQELDLCCFFAKLGFFIADFNHFAGRVVAGLWQSWESGLPEFAVHYFWCVEPQRTPCPQVQNPLPDPCQQMIDHPPIPQCTGNHPVTDPNTMMPVTRCGEFTCARTNIIIADLTDPFQGLLAKCTCEVLGLLDTLAALLFNLLTSLPGLQYASWACCLCGGYNATTNGCSRRTINFCPSGQIFTPLSEALAKHTGGSGVLPAVSYIVDALTTASFRLMRQLPFTCYWHPSLVYGQQVPMTVAQTWIFSFGGPTADALCIAVGNMQCFANSMFFLPQYCLARGEKFLGGTVRWAAEGIFRIIGFIEAFIETLIALPWSCIGGDCGQSYSGQPVKGINARRLGDMMVILLSWPFDALIGDADVACTTICPSTFSVPKPDFNVPPYYGCLAGAESCSCGCWNDSPNYANHQGGIPQPDGTVLPPYQWLPSNLGGADPGGLCRDMDPSLVNNGIIQHVGFLFGRTDGCCVRRNPALTNLPPAMPVCQSPDDSDLYFGTSSNLANVISHTPAGYPGSCAYKGACRPDQLPSCANDPVTPFGLSVNYKGALDGVVLAFMKYMRCLLDHTLTCQRDGAPCDSSKQFGIVFYPGILIFSLIWQLLGGLIRFWVAVIIFFFTLFTPPEGGVCACWEYTYVGGYGEDRTVYFRRGTGGIFGINGAFCYSCLVPNHKCGERVTGLGIDEQGASPYDTFKCRDYCPVQQRLRDPVIDAATAYARCLADYAIYQPKIFPTFSAAEVCSGHIASNRTVYQHAPSYPSAQATCTVPACTGPADGPNSCTTKNGQGLCTPLLGGASNCGQTSFHHYIPIDMCPDPYCINPANKTCVSYGPYCFTGIWPCGDTFSDTEIYGLFQQAPQVHCGAIQVVSAFLDVFHAFLAIWNTPFFITPNSSRRNANETFLDSVGEAARLLKNITARRDAAHAGTREPRSAWNARVKYYRFGGVLAGPGIDNTQRPNVAQLVAAALFDYDTSDCYADPVTCVCRNLDMSQHCYIGDNGTVVVVSKRYGRNRQAGGPLTMTPADLNTMLAEEVFVDTNICDHVVQSLAGRDWETQVTMNAKHPWVNCMDKRIQGSRLGTLTGGVAPDDLLYNGQAPLHMMNNLWNVGKTALREDRHAKARARAKLGHTPDRAAERRAEFERLFPKWQEQLRNRTAYARVALEKQWGITPNRLMFDAIVKADLLWFKYTNGYYRWAMKEAAAVLANEDAEMATFLPTREDALGEVKRTWNDLVNVAWRQRYGEIVYQTSKAGSRLARAAWDVYDEGVHIWAKRQWTTFDEHAKRRADPEQPERVRLLKESIVASPLYRMWFGVRPPTNSTESTPRKGVFAPFFEHMERVVANYRSPEGVKNSVNLFNADVYFWSLRDILLRRWQTPRWTPEKEEAWGGLQRLVRRVQHWMWPGSLSREQERFLYDSNCKLIDRTVNLTMQVVDYCANEFVVNTRGVLREQHSDLDGSEDHLFSSITSRSLHRSNGEWHHGWRNRHTFNYEVMPLSAEIGDPLAWRRPRLNYTAAADEYHTRWKARELHAQVHPRAYKRAVVDQRHGPNGKDLYDTLLDWFERIFGVAFHAQSDTWFDKVKAWFRNKNTDIRQYPDVGFLYAVKFEFVCWWPQSTTCMIGMGLERGLLWTVVAMVAIVVLSQVFLSFISTPFQIVGYGISFLLILAALSWHYPAACAFPPPFVAIPSCIMDEIWAFLNKWITNCYVPLVIPPYMVAGDTCPADPNTEIKILSCAQIGVRDGMQNLLYLGWWIWGQGFVDVWLKISSILFGAWLPGVNQYMQNTLMAFVNAGATDAERQRFCFWATSPAILTPLIIVVLVIVFAVAIVSAVLVLLQGLVSLFMASPASALVTGTQGNVWYQEDEEEEEDDEEEGDLDTVPTAAAQQPANIQRHMPVAAGWFDQLGFGASAKPAVRRRARGATQALWTKKNQ